MRYIVAAGFALGVAAHAFGQDVTTSKPNVAGAPVGASSAAAAVMGVARVDGDLKTISPGVAVAKESSKVTATVVGIAPKQRKLTLTIPKGGFIEVVVGPKISGFERILLGDRVTVSYSRQITFELRKVAKGSVRVAPNKSAAESTITDDKAASPYNVDVDVIRVLADIVAVDPKARTVVIRGPKKEAITVRLEDPDHFKVIRKGDQVVMSYLEAEVLTLEHAKK